MRDFTIDLVWAKLQLAFSAVGGWLGYFLGGVDGLMTTLIIFMVTDYVTGLMCAVVDKQLSSRVGNGTNYARITSAKAGTAFTHVATAENGWHAVVVGSRVGWVSGAFSRIDG